MGIFGLSVEFYRAFSGVGDLTYVRVYWEYCTSKQVGISKIWK